MNRALRYGKPVYTLMERKQGVPLFTRNDNLSLLLVNRLNMRSHPMRRRQLRLHYYLEFSFSAARVPVSWSSVACLLAGLSSHPPLRKKLIANDK